MLKTLIATTLVPVASVCQACSALATAPGQIRPVLIGTAMRYVALAALDGKATTLEKQVGVKPANRVLYQGGWCPCCHLQLSELRNVQALVEAMGKSMIVISADRPAALVVSGRSRRTISARH